MAAVYIHIPYCRRACHYCNFHFSTSLGSKNDFVAALLGEMRLRAHYLQDEMIETVYFGGGTPSLLTFEELGEIFSLLRAAFNLSPEAEITLEANPEDIRPASLKAWRRAGINRLSLGIQSFFDQDLRWMNRVHDAARASDTIVLAKQEGFSNISIDLIYGGPTLSDDGWHRNVDTAISWEIPHLSCYALTVEPHTALAKMMALGKTEHPTEEVQARQFLLLMDWMDSAGYQHYEISNFAKPGHRSRHNSSYWQGKSYLGLGPSAHSYNGQSRQWNVANNAQYIESLKKNELRSEIEWLSPIQQLNEYTMTSLRTMEGCDLGHVAAKFGEDARDRLTRAATPYQAKSLLRIDNHIVLTREGKLFADGITADLFVERL